MRFSSLGDWLNWQEGLHSSPIDMGLERVSAVLQRLDLSLPAATITVGGTNGKGSTVAMLDAILRAEGYRVGTYTSPHILVYNERICVNGMPVSDDDLIQAFERIDQARQDISLSFFEFGTLAALVIFSAKALDVQILEVGLGGRLDAVNMVDATAAIVTSIDIDHESWLGTHREAIAREKAGIFRPGRPAVLGDDRALPELEADSRLKGIELLISGRDFDFGKDADQNLWWWRGCQEGHSVTLEQLPRPALAGEHQYRNAAAVLQCLTSVHSCLPVSRQAVCHGLANVYVPGRFQRVATTPHQPAVVVDVAHNPAAAAVLARQITALMPGKRIEAVFSIMRDKDMEGVITALLPCIEHWHLVPLGHVQRAATPEQIRDIFMQMGEGHAVTVHESMEDALDRANARLTQDDMILVFGSFFLVSAFFSTHSNPSSQA